VSKADNVRIVNTGLSTLDGIDLSLVGNFDISNNVDLHTINVNEITNITGLASFSANNKDLQVSFPKLQAAKNMTFRNASLVEVPSLKSTEGLLGFYSNYFTSFSAPNLNTAGGLVFADNSALNNISLPVLKTVDGVFQIANNTALLIVDGFPKLETVDGALDFAGNFTTVELPSLKDVRGGFNMQSSGKLDCGPFDSLRSNVIQGSYTCLSEVDEPQSGTSTSTGANPTGTNKGDAGALNPPATMSLMALLGAVLQFFL